MVDARCIGGHPTAIPPIVAYHMKQARAQNRQLHKVTILPGGRRKVNKAPRELFGYRLLDKVRLGDREGFIFGRHSSGSFDVRTLWHTAICRGKLQKANTT